MEVGKNTIIYLFYVKKILENAVLKLIRRTLGEWDKQRVQSRLQAAYKNNGEGFYVNAPKGAGQI